MKLMTMDEKFLQTIFDLDAEVGGTLFPAMYKTFQNVWPDYVQKLDRSIEERNSKEASFHAHALKSLVGNFGATEVYETLNEIELLTKQEKWPFVAKMRSQFSLQFENFKNELAELHNYKLAAA